MMKKMKRFYFFAFASEFPHISNQKKGFTERLNKGKTEENSGVAKRDATQIGPRMFS